MFKSVSAAVLLAAGLLFVGPAPEAKAYSEGYTTYRYHTVYQVSYVTRYHDVWRPVYVTKIHRVVHVTLVKPIRYVKVITRIHYRPVVVWHRVDVYVRKYLPPRYVHEYYTVRY
jgi:hypothetical protein